VTRSAGRLPTFVTQFVLASVLVVASSYALGLKIVWAFSEQDCPPAHEVFYPIGQVSGGAWSCLPVGVTPPAGDMDWWNNLPTGHKDQRFGVYLANPEVRVLEFDNGRPHFIGLNVPAPLY
jgi:hypothetical protein